MPRICSVQFRYRPPQRLPSRFDHHWVPRLFRPGLSENNVGNGALFVIGLHRSGGAIALLPARLGGGKGSLELPYSPGHVVPGIA